MQDGRTTSDEHIYKTLRSERGATTRRRECVTLTRMSFFIETNQRKKASVAAALEVARPSDPGRCDVSLKAETYIANVFACMAFGASCEGRAFD